MTNRRPQPRESEAIADLKVTPESLLEKAEQELRAAASSTLAVEIRRQLGLDFWLPAAIRGAP